MGQHQYSLAIKTLEALEFFKETGLLATFGKIFNYNLIDFASSSNMYNIGCFTNMFLWQFVYQTNCNMLLIRSQILFKQLHGPNIWSFCWFQFPQKNSPYMPSCLCLIQEYQFHTKSLSQYHGCCQYTEARPTP